MKANYDMLECVVIKDAKKQNIQAWFIMVLNPWSGSWKRVGNVYWKKETARDWVPFVKSAWRGCRTKIASCTIRFCNGKITDKSAKILDQKFNMELPTEFPLKGNQ